MTQGEIEARTSNVVISQIPIAHTLAYTLMYLGAADSFIAASFIKKLDILSELLDDVCNISLSSGENLMSCSFKVVPIKIVGWELPVDLIVLKMVDYNVTMLYWA